MKAEEKTIVFLYANTNPLELSKFSIKRHFLHEILTLPKVNRPELDIGFKHLVLHQLWLNLTLCSTMEKKHL